MKKKKKVEHVARYEGILGKYTFRRNSLEEVKEAARFSGIPVEECLYYEEEIEEDTTPNPMYKKKNG